MKNHLISLGLGFVLSATCSAQFLTTENGSKSDAITIKLHQIDLMDQLLPLAMTNDQINQLLPVLERARVKEKAIYEQEDQDLADMSPDIDKTLSDAVDKGVYPPRSFLDKVAAKTAAMGKRREVAFALITVTMTDALKGILDAGQMKVLTNSFDPRFINPAIPAKEMPDTMKQQFFIQRVILDAMSHDLLVKMLSRKVPPTPPATTGGTATGGTGGGAGAGR